MKKATLLLVSLIIPGYIIGSDRIENDRGPLRESEMVHFYHIEPTDSARRFDPTSNALMGACMNGDKPRAIFCLKRLKTDLNINTALKLALRGRHYSIAWLVFVKKCYFSTRKAMGRTFEA